MPVEDNAVSRRLLAGLPDRYGWANGDTHRCANEGGYCACDGNVVYTKKCAGTFSCNRASWGRVVSERWNSNHKANVNGGVRFSSDWWKGVWCGFSCTGACPARAAAFALGREHTFPIEQCAEHCYCVFKGWTA